MAPTVRAAREGFPLPAACHYFLGYAGDIIFARSDDGHAALHDDHGALREVGSTIRVPHLADSLDAIANEGDAVFYRGEIGQRIVDHVRERGGLLTRQDLGAYRPDVRRSLLIGMGDWKIASNPPPAIGGANLAAMLLAFGTSAFRDWDEEQIRRLVRAQHAVMGYRKERLDSAEDVAGPVRRMLELARSGEMVSRWASAATVHTSTVDGDGTACAITASSGYGSGEMPAGTGLWLNNCLGELELNLQGLEAAPPGKRLPSNMAPSVARSKTGVLAVGSPGADRITTALHQFLVNFLQRGLTLEQAVAWPRMHLRIRESHLDLAFEPGLDIPALDHPVSAFDSINMYFGGVAVALQETGSRFEAAADPRREGGIFVTP
jgi:gamma-glutamyltranspeptidase/glutathione hydrolase